MNENSIAFLHSAKEFSEWINGNQKWVQFYPYDTWTHPIYSDTTIDQQVAAQMVQTFNDRAMGRDLVVEYDHGLDAAKGGKAAGKVIKVEARTDGLWGLVQFNDVAKQEIDSGEWNFWSTSHYDTWTHPQTQQTYNYVLDNPSLTNRPYVRGMAPLNHSEIVIEHTDEVVEGEPPVDNPDDENNDNNENNEGGDMETEELIKNLRSTLGVGDDVNLVAHVKRMNDELEPLRELKKEHSERKAFSDMFPAEAKRLAELEVRDRENYAKEFSESFKNVRFTTKEGDEDKETGLGFSALVLETIKDKAKKFNEGTASLEDLSDVLTAIKNNGVVDYGERGSGRSKDDEPEIKPKNFSDARKMFSELVDSIVEEDKVTFDAAYALAAKRNPELFRAYKEKKPAIAAGEATAA